MESHGRSSHCRDVNDDHVSPLEVQDCQAEPSPLPTRGNQPSTNASGEEDEIVQWSMTIA